MACLSFLIFLLETLNIYNHMVQIFPSIDLLSKACQQFPVSNQFQPHDLESLMNFM